MMLIALYRKAMDNNMANTRESVGIYTFLNRGGVTVGNKIVVGPKVNGNMIRHYIFEKFVDLAIEHAKAHDGEYYLGLTSTALIKEGYRYPDKTPKVRYNGNWFFEKVEADGIEIHGVGKVKVQNGEIVEAEDVAATNGEELVKYFADADVFGYLIPSKSIKRTSILHVSDAVAVEGMIFQTVHARMKVSDEFEGLIEGGAKTQQRMVKETASGAYVGEVAVDYARLGLTEVVEGDTYRKARVISDSEYERRKKILNLAVAEVLLNPFGANMARNQPLTHLLDALIVVVKNAPIRPALTPPQYPDYIPKSIESVGDFIDTARGLGYRAKVEVYVYNYPLSEPPEFVKVLTTPEELRKELAGI
ncbi:hypothetical protein [Pyrococcus kukulkanii]|uniref:hypothetical protein n=1 Tax=Pyrococcus kukulkanii TaxID=1609559 RepID=UPI0035692231